MLLLCASLGAVERTSVSATEVINGTKQEAFEKCWAHSPQRAASRQFTRCRHCTVARRLRIDVHDANDDNDNDNA